MYDHKQQARSAIRDVNSGMSLIPINNVVDRMSVSIPGCLFLCVYVVEGVALQLGKRPETHQDRPNSTMLFNEDCI